MRSYKFEVFTVSIEKNIRKGIYQPGQRLPSVRDLKKMHH
ncbi:GntR family transcriptional regulator [Olivibacter sp. 47]|nr:GntR family transcriptional regulator [Olivibacter sp. 47]MDM8173542.1 GntR family transcriptional regulator [Olivibacter sp. 47]